MTDRNSPYGRNQNGVPNRPNERTVIVIYSDNPEMAKGWKEYIDNYAPVLTALPIPVVKTTGEDQAAEGEKLKAAFIEGWDQGAAEQQSWGSGTMPSQWEVNRREELWQKADSFLLTDANGWYSQAQLDEIATHPAPSSDD